MAKNTNKGSRKGAVTSRSQVLNPATGNYVKRDAASGQFIAVKADGKPFKGVAREKTSIRSNPSVPKKVAQKAESAVIKVISGSQGQVIITVTSAKKTAKKPKPASRSAKKSAPKRVVASKKKSSSATTKKTAIKRKAPKKVTTTKKASVKKATARKKPKK